MSDVAGSSMGDDTPQSAHGIIPFPRGNLRIIGERKASIGVLGFMAPHYSNTMGVSDDSLTPSRGVRRGKVGSSFCGFH